MKLIRGVLFLVLFFANSISHAQNYDGEGLIQTEPLTIGESLEFKSQILKEKRTLNVYLPHGYSPDSVKTYPVIYLLDGSMDEDFLHVAGLVQFGSFSWINMIPESIVVGIGNMDRKKDFTYPSNNKLDKEDLPTSGASDNFIQFIQKEVQPLIDKTYRTNNTRTIIGQSLGGLLATEILFKLPDLFDHYIIVSPSLWWDDESLLQLKPAEHEGKKSVYIAVGKEGATMERLAKELHEKLLLFQDRYRSLGFGFFEKLDHGDTLHQALYSGFEEIFGEKK